MMSGRMTKAEERRVVKALNKNMDALAEEDPRYGALFDLLLHIGGVAVAAVKEPDLEQLLRRGYLQTGEGAGLVQGQPTRCHENAACLWVQNPKSTVIVTGWALSDDGLWRQHSWTKDL